MSWWMCDTCSYVFEAEEPPESCPQCQAKCVYSEVTCYVPECGGPDHIDVKLVALKAKEQKKPIK
ncbi:MAG: hypothetical protein Q7R34_00935 [Dehalococcoidia bacterium]|nr:hypothetical protein [Dehalococcoidia bacterium]